MAGIFTACLLLELILRLSAGFSCCSLHFTLLVEQFCFSPPSSHGCPSILLQCQLIYLPAALSPWNFNCLLTANFTSLGCLSVGLWWILVAISSRRRSQSSGSMTAYNGTILLGTSLLPTRIGCGWEQPQQYWSWRMSQKVLWIPLNLQGDSPCVLGYLLKTWKRTSIMPTSGPEAVCWRSQKTSSPLPKISVLPTWNIWYWWINNLWCTSSSQGHWFSAWPWERRLWRSSGHNCWRSPHCWSGQKTQNLHCNRCHNLWPVLMGLTLGSAMAYEVGCSPYNLPHPFARENIGEKEYQPKEVWLLQSQWLCLWYISGTLPWCIVVRNSLY